MPFQTIVRDYMKNKKIADELPKCHATVPMKDDKKTPNISFVCEQLEVMDDHRVIFKSDNKLGFTVDQRREFLNLIVRAIKNAVPEAKVITRHECKNEEDEEMQSLLSPKSPLSISVSNNDTNPDNPELQLSANLATLITDSMCQNNVMHRARFFDLSKRQSDQNQTKLPFCVIS